MPAKDGFSLVLSPGRPCQRYEKKRLLPAFRLVYIRPAAFTGRSAMLGIPEQEELTPWNPSCYRGFVSAAGWSIRSGDRSPARTVRPIFPRRRSRFCCAWPRHRRSWSRARNCWNRSGARARARTRRSATPSARSAAPSTTITTIRASSRPCRAAVIVCWYCRRSTTRPPRPPRCRPGRTGGSRCFGTASSRPRPPISS